MKVIDARNVNGAYQQGIMYLREQGDEEQSRAGPVLVSPVPVTTVYRRPYERVLFEPKRRANPFFHLFESVWMLAGSRRGIFLDRFVGDFSKRFGEPDIEGTIYGAYGYRWRHHFGFDQLQKIITEFEERPNSRQCVLSMWDPMADLGRPDYKDRPCNTHIYFRNNAGYLDMTVCNRSNDIIWGAYGANAVHMSFMHEWLATTLDMKVGNYFQVSNNYHAYLDTFIKVGIPSCDDVYNKGAVQHYPLPGGTSFLDDCEQWVWLNGPAHHVYWKTTYFAHVVLPMERAHTLCKAKQYDAARKELESCKASDWRLAAERWIDDHAR